jgi:hypothetical protein
MYDTSFDHSGAEVRKSDRRALWALRIAALIATVVVAASAEAQFPGTPVLQNVWATPGIVAALDIAGGSDGTVYAAAGSWTPGSGRFQLTGGLGYQTKTGNSGSSGGVYGVRVAMPFGGASSSFGFAGFAGAGGGGSQNKVTESVPGPTPPDSSISTAQFPVGAAIGWRRAIGSNHGVSVYATPAYVFFTGGSKTGGLFRTGLGADFGITSSMGATAGVDFGQSRPRGFGGPSGTTYGVGVSYAFGKR